MKIHVGNNEIHLNEEHLKFDESSVNSRLQEESSLYSYYAGMLAKANYVLTTLEDTYELEYNKKFSEFKDGGISDKAAESKAKVDDSVVESLKKVRLAKVNRDLLQSYLRSFDKSHDCLMNLCFNMRKELDKLFGGSIKKTSDPEWSEMVSEADTIVKKKK